jgi:hypothetical protein
VTWNKSVNFFPGTQFSCKNKIDHHDITEILLKTALNTITLINPTYRSTCVHPRLHTTEKNVSIFYLSPHRKGTFHWYTVLCYNGAVSRFLPQITICSDTRYDYRTNLLRAPKKRSVQHKLYHQGLCLL